MLLTFEEPRRTADERRNYINSHLANAQMAKSQGLEITNTSVAEPALFFLHQNDSLCSNEWVDDTRPMSDRNSCRNSVCFKRGFDSLRTVP